MWKKEDNQIRQQVSSSEQAPKKTAALKHPWEVIFYFYFF